MTTEANEYEKLSDGGWSSFFGFLLSRASLWLAPDHLLQLKLSAANQETAQRFYFRDIQALVLVKTRGWQMGNLLLGILTAGFFLLAVLMLYADDAGGAGVALLIAGGVAGLIFLINLLAGPTCVCQLKTAVHQEELPALRRLRQARKIIGRLQPFIEEAQGVVSREEVAAQFGSILDQLNLVAPVAVGRPLAPKAALKPYRSRMHRVLYCLLLPDAAGSGLHIFLPSTPVIFFALLTKLALGGALILALVRQTETDLKPALKSLTFWVALYVVADYLTGYIILLALSTSHHISDGTQLGMIRTVAALKPRDIPWLLNVLVTGAVVSLGLSLWGNLLLSKHWGDRRAMAEVPAPPPIR